MTKRGLWLVLAVTAAFGVFAGSAAASGPAAPGKQTVVLTCDGFPNPLTVAVAPGQNSNGAGQIVDMKGHGIPAAFNFTVTDMTTAMLLDSEPSVVGNGNAHQNQQTTHCSGVEFDGSASAFFGTQLPSGVSPDDQIVATIDVWVVLKGF
jgi:hypothetical protein